MRLAQGLFEENAVRCHSFDDRGSPVPPWRCPLRRWVGRPSGRGARGETTPTGGNAGMKSHQCQKSGAPTLLRWLPLRGVAACGLAWCSAGGALADEFNTDFFNPRAAGMGGATVTVSNDEYAPFGNPAGLARVSKPRNKDQVKLLSVPGFVVVTNSQTMNAVKGARPTLTRLLNKVIDSAADHQGVPSFVTLQSYPAVVLGGKRGPLFLLGLTTKTDVSSVFQPNLDEGAATTTGSFETRSTVGAVLGLAGVTYGGVLSAGLSVRPQMRYHTTQQVEATDSTSLRAIFDATKSGSGRSFALASDAGIQLRAMDFWLPTLGISVRNIPTGCVTDFYNSFSKKTVSMCGVIFSGGTDVAPMETRVGVAVIPRISLGRTRLNLRLAGEMGPLGVVYKGLSWGYAGVNINRLVHLGAELFLGDASIEPEFAVRGGYNQGSVTYGLSAQLWALRLDGAMTVEDTGEGTVRRLDRRYLVGLSAQF